MADEVDLEEALDALYATPPEDFTAARNGLAKALKAAGRKDEAAEVTALRKPNRLVWALDQLALDDDPTLPPLLDAVEVVRDGGGEDLKAAVADLRDAVAAAARAAAGRLDPKRPTDRPELAAALNAVVADADAAGLLAAGRLLEVPAPDAFGLGPSLPAPAPKKRPAPKKKTTTTAAPPVDQLAVRRAEKRRKEAAKAHDSAQRALARAEKAAVAEAEAAQAAETERAEATEAVAAAEAALAVAQAALGKAEAASAAAAEAHERATADLAETQERAAATSAELDAATTDLDALT